MRTKIKKLKIPKKIIKKNFCSYICSCECEFKTLVMLFCLLRNSQNMNQKLIN